jgi:hypothetical protein
MHSYVLMVSQQYQKHNKKHYGLGNFNVTNIQTNNFLSFIDRFENWIHGGLPH